MIDREKVIKAIEYCTGDSFVCYGDKCPYWKDDVRAIVCWENLMKDASELLKADQTYLQEQKKIKELEEEISELREDLTEMSMNGGTGSQQVVCLYLLNLMDVIEERQRMLDDEQS